jgi:acetyltransferase
MSEMGPGINKVVSMGNKTDLDEGDYLQFMLEDPGTEVICLYLESIADGRRLIEMSRSAGKPIIIQKANIAQQSSQIAYSHTAALANDDQIVDAALRQVGIPRAASFGDAVALAQGCLLPAVRGNRLVVASRSGGHAVVAADLAARYGFELIPIPDEFLARVQRLNRADVIALTNPLDLGAIYDFDLYGLIVHEALDGLDADALLLIQTSSIGREAEMTGQLGRSVQRIARELDKPVAFCVFTHTEEVAQISEGLNLPIFTEIEAAMRALAASRDRTINLTRPALLALPQGPQDRPHEVEGLLRLDGPLAADTALGLVAAYGIPTAEWAVVESLEGAMVAASAIGFPVALKVISPEVVHKSDVGGVALDIRNRAAVRTAYGDLLARVQQRVPQLEVEDVLVQRMLSGGREVILGGKQDPSFGPVVMFGLGGIYAEVFRDVVFRLAPLVADEARRMISEVRGINLLQGVRGEPARDLDAVVDALVALSQLMVACPEVQEIDINPLLVFERGVVAVDARAVVTKVKLD